MSTEVGQVAKEHELGRWTQIAAEIEAWDGDIAAGKSLLKAIRALGKLEMRVDDPRVALLRAARGNIASGETDKLASGPVVYVRLAACDDAVAWPWSTPSRLVQDLYMGAKAGESSKGGKSAEKSPLDASPQRFWKYVYGHAMRYARLAGIVAAMGAPSAKAAREWLHLVFRLRERDFWVPSALVWSELLTGALAKGEDREWLEQRATTLVKAKGDAEKKAQLGDDEPIERHLRTLSMLVAMREGSFCKRDARAWIDAAVVQNYDSTTAVAGALVEAAQYFGGELGERAATLAEYALGRFRDETTKVGKQLSYQAWSPARGLLELRKGVASEDVLALLFDPNPHGNERSPDQLAGDLFDAGVTLRWLAGDPAYCEDVPDALTPELTDAYRRRLLEGRLAQASSVVRAASYDPNDWTERLTRALGALREDAWRASPKTEGVTRLVEAAWLLELPEARDLDWPSVARECGANWIEPTHGKVSEVGWVDVAAVASERKAMSPYFLHRREVDTVPAISGLKGGSAPHVGSKGLSRLLRSRWRRGEEKGWAFDGHLTQQAGNHLVRRLVRANGDVAEQARILLVAISVDNPPEGARTLVEGIEETKGKKQDGLWEHVHEWLPDPALREALEPLVVWEAKRPKSAAACVADADEALAAIASRMPALGDVTAPVKEVGALALVAARHAPRCATSETPEVSSREASWVVSGLDAAEELAATPVVMREWAKRFLVPLERALRVATKTIETHLEAPGVFQGLTTNEIKAHTAAVAAATKADAPLVRCPVLDDDGVRTWSACLASLRKLAEPLPTASEVALDTLAFAIEGWIDEARKNHQRRQEKLEEVDEAMADGNEARLVELLEQDHALLGDGVLRKAGVFFLQRLAFDKARRVRDAWKGPVPSALSYFSPLLFGVVGAPLSAIQTDKIWAPVLEAVSKSATAIQYHCVVWTLFFVSASMLWAELKRGAATLPVVEARKRAVVPAIMLFGLNYAINAFVYQVAPQGDGNHAGPLATVFLWGSLSLFMGVFLGLIAQGRRPMEEGA